MLASKGNYSMNWSEEPFMIWKLILYKEDDKTGEQKFYTTNENFNHSTIAEISYDDDEVTEIKEEDI